MANTSVEQWQQAIGVTVDGSFGPKTLARSMEIFEVSGFHGSLPDRSDLPRGFQLTHADEAILSSVKPELQAVVRLAAANSTRRFRVFEGLRTLEIQKAYVARGVSKTLNSRHLTGDAVDLWPLGDYDGDGSFETDHKDMVAFKEVVQAMVEAAKDLNFPLTSGGLAWGWDWYHFQRTWGK